MKTRLLSIAIILAFCLSLVAVAAPPVASPARAATTWYVDPGASIQAAVDAASPGDTIIVRDGTYIENVDVNKDHLTIRSESGAESTIVQAANPNDHVFEVTADYVNIYGFTVKGATGQKTYTESFEDGYGRWLTEEFLAAYNVANQMSGTTSIVTGPYPVHSGEHSVCQRPRYAGDAVVGDLLPLLTEIFIPCSPGEAEYSMETWIYVEERECASTGIGLGFPKGLGAELVGWNPWGDNDSYTYPGGDLSWIYKPVGLPRGSWHDVKVTYYAPIRG
jgi:hypothetical protein